ncbi:hypothetical protein ACSBL2_18205 [Pedobacter sp. AW31-3R]|uniref:hypothetical protein n=1 Tax=Pedobacter sp. AW31-3R TaxID=3445781 RepID=UPI003FA09403
MTRFFLLLLCLTIAYRAAAAPADTSAYQTQRLKINSLLAERSAKFGQYDLSLSARTGIFGLQTKQDLKNSNDILREIILNDNNIFRELKILMNYKDMQVQEVRNTASTNSKRIQAYQLSIKRLQDQNEALKTQTLQEEDKSGVSTYIIILLSCIIVAGSFFFYSRIRQLKNIQTGNQ